MGLLVFDAGHKEVYVALYICGEVFHELVELWPGCHIDATVYLGHWKEWYSSPMGVPLQNLQVRCSLGVWVCRPNLMSSL